VPADRPGRARLGVLSLAEGLGHPGTVGEQVADLGDAGGVQAVDGLVEDEQAGGVQQGQGQALQVAERLADLAPVT
jgi:hypothetical protein